MFMQHQELPFTNGPVRQEHGSKIQNYFCENLLYFMFLGRGNTTAK